MPITEPALATIKLTPESREALRAELAKDCANLSFSGWLEISGLGLTARQIGSLLPLGYRARTIPNGVRIYRC
jgi:hypothetical protein